MEGGRWGFSTGACAAAAAKAAALAASGFEVPASVEIPFPDGQRRSLLVAWARRLSGNGVASCENGGKTGFENDGGEAGVIKDAGDDPDITDGATLIVELTPARDWHFEAGEGVGVVTKPGLQIPVGEPAINPSPRAMIRETLQELDWTGARIRISIPGGRELAARTFNPRLGVEGGLSILGTTGRVRPFSLEAVRATISCGLNVARAAGLKTVALVPGHLGERALRVHMELEEAQLVEVSNEWGHALDESVAKGFRALLLAGHPGKLAKLAQGNFDTHSSRSPSALACLRALAEEQTGQTIGETVTVEGIFQALEPDARIGLAENVARSVAKTVEARTGLPCAVLLTTMDAQVYGGFLEGTPWA